MKKKAYSINIMCDNSFFFRYIVTIIGTGRNFSIAYTLKKNAVVSFWKGASTKQSSVTHKRCKCASSTHAQLCDRQVWTAEAWIFKHLTGHSASSFCTFLSLFCNTFTARVVHKNVSYADCICAKGCKHFVQQSLGGDSTSTGFQRTVWSMH